MDAPDSVVSSQTKQSSWRKSDTTWTLGLFGIVIGAGVSLFPIHAGFDGLIPILPMLALAYPIVFCCHQALTRPCLSDSNPSGSITEMVEEYLGETDDVAVTFPYLLATCPLLWIYGTTVTNTFMAPWEDRLGFTPPNRGFVVLLPLLLMAFVTWFGKGLVVKAMSCLVRPFITSLVLVLSSLIPYWNSAVINQADLGSLSLTGHDGISITVWLGVFIMVPSFNFSSIASFFVISRCEEYKEDFGRDFTERRCSQIVPRASMLMVAAMMFFTFSCLFTLSPASMAEAKVQNIPVLSYLASRFASTTGTKTTSAITLEYAVSTITLATIFRSFFGHYLGALEGLNGLILKFSYKGDKTKVSLGKLNAISMTFIMGSIRVIAYANLNIPDLIEVMGVPIIAPLLYLLPMYVVRRAPSLAKYHGRPDNVFVTMTGLLAILNIVYKLF